MKGSAAAVETGREAAAENANAAETDGEAAAESAAAAAARAERGGGATGSITNTVGGPGVRVLSGRRRVQ